MKTLMVHVETEELVGHVVSHSEDEIIQFIKDVDSQAQSWSLTQDLCKYFLKEMRGYYETEESFVDFLNGIKGELCQDV